MYGGVDVVENASILLGICAGRLVALEPSLLVEPATAAAFVRLAERAAVKGFDLRAASAFRDYDRQALIINQKWTGERPVSDTSGQLLERERMSDRQWLEAILRFSALPGTSRHHWGTDLDIWDASAVSVDYRPRLEPSEYAPESVFAELTGWLDELIAADNAEGFYKPYDMDRGGVAPEPWHISYRPVATSLQKDQCIDICWPLWRGEPDPKGHCHEAMAMLMVLERYGEAMFNRFVLI